MLNCQHVRDLFTEYFDNTLARETRRDVEAHLDSCASCAAEYRDFAKPLALLQALPDPEPVLDLWQEFVPKMAAWEEEQKLSLLPRLLQQWHRTTAHIAEGVILYTGVLAHRTNERLERYLIRDPFAASEIE